MKKMLFLLLLLLSICSVGLAADNTQDFYKLEMQRLMRKVRTEGLRILLRLSKKVAERRPFLI